MAGRSDKDGFLEKMLGPLPGQSRAEVRWVGEPVLDHLLLLLNTRQGSIRNLPDYGLPDISSYYSDYPSSLAALRSVIERLIEKYEPRLRNVRVRLIETESKEFKASFLITGDLVEDSEESGQVQYRTTIKANGHASMGDDELD